VITSSLLLAHHCFFFDQLRAFDQRKQSLYIETPVITGRFLDLEAHEEWNRAVTPP
jgi:hypothetical protein